MKTRPAYQYPMIVSALVLIALMAVPAFSEALHWLWPSWQEWVVGYDAKDKTQAITEFVPKGEKIEDWTELVTIQNLRKKGFPASEEAMNVLKQKMTERCPNVVWSVIERIKQDIIYEWRIENCSPNPDQHEIARFLVGKTNVFRLAYTAKVKEISPDRRNEWLERLRQAAVH